MSAKPEQSFDEHDALNDRFRLSGIASALRASNGIHNGLGVLNHQMTRPKNSRWQGETAWILDGIKFSAIDGLDIQKALGHTDAPTYADDVSYLKRSCHQARQALLSSEIPIVAAQEFGKNLNPFIAKCTQILGSMQVMINTEQERNNEKNRQSMADSARPKDMNSPSKKGV